MPFKEIKTTKGAFVKKALVEEFDNSPKTDKKTKVRKEIQEQVFDDRDAIADNAKMISFLITLTSRMYDIIPAEQKDLLKADDKDLIEHIFAKFRITNTRADIQLQEEGTVLIDRLLERQADIGKLVK